MIYIFENNSLITEENIHKYLQLVSKERQQKIESYRFLKDKRNCLLSYLLLSYALYKEYGILEKPLFYYNEYNKPFLEKLPFIHFNISHCDNAVLCATSHMSVGVDIENLLKFDSRIAKHFFTAEEKRALGQIHNKDILFTQIWTLKESYGKYIGKGLDYDLLSMNFDDLSDGWNKKRGIYFYSKVNSNYAVSVCSEEILKIEIVSTEKLESYIMNME